MKRVLAISIWEEGPAQTIPTRRRRNGHDKEVNREKGVSLPAATPHIFSSYMIQPTQVEERPRLYLFQDGGFIVR